MESANHPAGPVVRSIGLTPDQCRSLIRLADPAGTGRLHPSDLARVRADIAQATASLAGTVSTLSRQDAADAMLVSDGLAALATTLDLIHAAP